MKRKFRSLTAVFAMVLALSLFLTALPVEASAALRTYEEFKKSRGLTTSSDDGGVLMADACYVEKGLVFGSDITRDKIKSVTFLDSLSTEGSDSWDVSQDKDGSVKAWVKRSGSKYDLYIGAKGTVYAPENCSGMFYGYTNLEQIDFDGCFETEDATTMSYMFSYCSDLISIDCSDFDTSEVTKMECMFMGCSDLMDVDVSSFDTSKVWDMGSMFWGCRSLCYIDISNFDYGKVSNGGYMFEQCAPGIKVIW